MREIHNSYGPGYSVPRRLVHEPVELRVSANTV